MEATVGVVIALLVGVLLEVDWLVVVGVGCTEVVAAVGKLGFTVSLSEINNAKNLFWKIFENAMMPVYF